MWLLEGRDAVIQEMIHNRTINIMLVVSLHFHGHMCKNGCQCMILDSLYLLLRSFQVSNKIWAMTIKQKRLPHFLLHEAGDGSTVKNASENFYCTYCKGKIWTPGQSYVLPSCVPSTSCGYKSFGNICCKHFSCGLPCVLNKLPVKQFFIGISNIFIINNSEQCLVTFLTHFIQHMDVT